MRIRFTLDVKITGEKLQTVYNANLEYGITVILLYDIIIIMVLQICIVNMQTIYHANI